MRARRSIMVIISLSLLGVVAGTAQTEAASIAASPDEALSDLTPMNPDLDLSEDCVQIARVQHVAAVRPDGSELEPRDGDGFGRVHYLELAGSQVEQRSAPLGWDPETAADVALRSFGFAPRPKGEEERRLWSQNMADARQPAPAGMCETDRVNNIINTETSSNWAGGAAVQPINPSGYVETHMDWQQAGFDHVCPGQLSGSSYSTWSGLGGKTSSRLIQSGTDTSKSYVNGIYAWWELISYLTTNPEVAFTGSSVAPGDNVSTSPYYDRENNRVYFNVIDHTTQTYWTANLELYAGQSMDKYYDGSSAEFITEAPSGGPAPGGLSYLRKPHRNTTLITFLHADYQSIEARDSVRIVEKNASGQLMQASNFSDVWGADWSTTWKQCS